MTEDTKHGAVYLIKSHQPASKIMFVVYMLWLRLNISCLKRVRGQSWRRATKCDYKIDWLWIRSPLEEMTYLLKCIFRFLRSGVEAKRAVEYYHLTRNASRIRQKVRNGVS